MAGRELDAMAGDLSKWMGAVSDVVNIEKRAKNPPLLKKLFYKDSIESEAIEAFAAKKKLQQQRDELKTYITFSYGTAAWDELISMEGTIRKRRQKEIYEAQERKDRFVFWVVLILMFVIGSGLLGLFAYFLYVLDSA